jgi:hypothetical protein
VTPLDLADVTAATFAPLAGDAFAVPAAGVDLVLRTVTEHAERPGARTPFSLEFDGPVEPLLPQQIHRLEHPGLGALEIFIVPIGQDAQGTRYEAVFA